MGLRESGEGDGGGESQLTRGHRKRICHTEF